jgi:hypothetical protein
MSKTLLKPAGVRAESGNPLAPYNHEPTTLRSTATMNATQYGYAQEMHRERLRQAEAQRLRRTAYRARRGLAARLLGGKR